MNDETKNIHMTGEIVDKIYDTHGNLIEVREGHNLVVNSFLPLIMSLCKSGISGSGIKYWAVGSGASTWDSSIPSPTLNETKLTNEIGRVAITSSNIKFLDSNFIESANPTNIIQITRTFGSEDCNGSWREFGLFGGSTATATKNSGMMVNKKHHPIITKTPEMVVERTMKFTLSLV